MPGFDPREPETYWGLFRRESRLTAQRRGMVIAVSDAERSADGLRLDWQVRAEGAETRYTLLRWDDIVRDRFPRPNWRRLIEVPTLWLRLQRSAYPRKLKREGHRFARVIIGIHIVYAALALLSIGLAAALVAFSPASALPPPVRLLVVPILAYAILGLIMVATRGRPLYVAHLVDDTAFTHDHASGAEPRMHGRLDAFAEVIRAAEGQASEIVLIGHSSSSFLAVEALDRILAHDPDFGRRGTPVSFVTIGSVTPWITLDPLAVKARTALARVAAATAIGWLDVRAKWDWLSIHRRDPLRASGLPSPGRGRPIVIHVRLDDLIEKRIIRRRKWNLFRMHFQLLMSSREPTAFDYIAFVAGPEPVHAAIERWRTTPSGPLTRLA